MTDSVLRKALGALLAAVVLGFKGSIEKDPSTERI